MHKSGGSLTQSSLLLCGPAMQEGHVRQIINLTQTTSGSYLLLSSLDISRRNLALRGREAFSQVVGLADYARGEINQIGGYYAFSKELINGDSVFDFDRTKLSVNTLEVAWRASRSTTCCGTSTTYRLSSGTWGTFWAYLSIGDRPRRSSGWSAPCRRCAGALAGRTRRLMRQEYIDPEVVLSPQDAFYAQKTSLPLEETAGRVVQRVCHVLPAGHPHPGPGGADYPRRLSGTSSTPRRRAAL